MKKDKWIWMPHSAHLIVGDKCQFHLATYVGKYIVSTVGEYWNERLVREIHAEIVDKEWLSKNKHLKGDEFDSVYFKRFGFEEIGCDRKYETMVFKAEKRKGKEWQCCPFKIIVEENVDMKGYNDAVSATKGHMKLCDKWSKK